MKQCLALLRMSSAAKTHIGRESGAQMAELDGATEGYIRRLGQWNSQALSRYYLTFPPQPALRTMAGSPPETGYSHIKGLQLFLQEYYRADSLLGLVITVMFVKVGKDFGSTRLQMSFKISVYCYFARCSCVD
jgi:hypothetical protein